MRKKSDEENFEEAEAQAYRAWTTTTVPFETRELFSDPNVLSLSPTSAPFFHLVHALSKFVQEQPSHNLPLTSTLPDMKASTGSYIHLQKLYKARAEEEKAIFKSYLQVPVSEDMVDAFVKNSHALKLLKGKKWGALDADPQALSTVLYRFDSCGFTDNFMRVANAVETAPKQLATHLALTALSSFATKQQHNAPLTPTMQALTGEALALLPPGTELPEDFEAAVGEVYVSSLLSVRQIYHSSNESTTRSVRAPTADLPNTAALLGGVVAQEVIKMITKQYIPINGSCIIDLIETWTGVL